MTHYKLFIYWNHIDESIKFCVGMFCICCCFTVSLSSWLAGIAHVNIALQVKRLIVSIHVHQFQPQVLTPLILKFVEVLVLYNIDEVAVYLFCIGLLCSMFGHFILALIGFYHILHYFIVRNLMFFSTAVLFINNACAVNLIGVVETDTLCDSLYVRLCTDQKAPSFYFVMIG